MADGDDGTRLGQLGDLAFGDGFGRYGDHHEHASCAQPLDDGDGPGIQRAQKAGGMGATAGEA